ncbi:putative ribosomal protein L3 [Candidatus Carsonella ruddii CS isolate Thao2000]|uniref:Large ribosomal subunit protein uL3 n=1 Tax=Candidatus Carsonella ruddii CS isolate Thao2000 TaxID=1202537 RepID=J7GYY9_CARRU|nr:putative ribosomal protein L3 [Candidatus Carsonella ruddii CS isolate Thao2000]
MIFINKGSKHFFFKKKIYIFNIIKFSKFNKFYLNFFINKMLLVCYSKGKGFQGVIKRWNFKTKDKSHGNSLSYRTLGSTGQCQDPGRVLKKKKMPGRMGNKKISLFVNIFFRKKNYFFLKKILPGVKNDILLGKII